MNHIIHYITTNLKTILQDVCRKISSCIRNTAFRFILTTAFLGTLNHFLYFLSGQSPIIALFCPVNESVVGTFETFIFSFFIRKHMGISVSASGCFTVLLLSVSGCASRNVFYCFCFYTYSGILGRNFLILDILLFYSSVIFSFGMSEYISGKTRSPHETEPGFVVSLWLITSFFFFVFTCFPPDLPLFYSA